MRSRLKGRLTYATVMATIAVFIALGGASFAALRVPPHSVGTRQLKKASVGQRQLKKPSVGRLELASDSVGNPELQTESVAAENLQQGSVGPDALQANAVNSDQLFPGSVTSREVRNFSLEAEDIDSGAAVKPLFAHVRFDGQLAEQSGVTSVSRLSTGEYTVDFNRKLQGCVAVATVGFGFGTGSIAAGATAQARMNKDNQADRVGVTIYRGFTFNDGVDSDFHLVVVC